MGERITKARNARGISQSELARQCDIAATQLSRYETGRASPRKLAVARLAQALAVSYSWLLTGAGEMDEYPDAGPGGLTFSVDEELADRLRAYGEYNGLTLVESLADILDNPLSVYSEEMLPDTADEQARLKKTIQSYGRKSARIGVVAKKIRLHK